MRYPIVLLCLSSLLGFSTSLSSAVIRVPADQPTVQAGLNAAFAGDTVEVSAGVYSEKVIFPRSGSAGQPIILRAAPGIRPVLDGTGVTGDNMVLIDSRSHVSVIGFELRNNLGVSDGSGVRVLGSGTGIEIRDNMIHEIRGSDAMGITVYGTQPTSISNLVIADNQIFDCDPANSEALTLNGNVDGFQITGNLIRDVNNIGIDMIGGETDIQPDSTLVARNGLVRGNTVIRANSPSGFAGGIYVDGGRDIVVENNVVTESDLGIEIAAENVGVVARNVVVRNNVLYRNERAGLVFGGFNAAVGRTEDCSFTGNTLFENNTVGFDGQGIYVTGGGISEIWIQWASDNVVENNIVHAGPANIFVGSFDFGSSVNNALNYNLYFSGDPAGGEFSLNGQGFTGLASWQANTTQDANSLVADPLLVNGAAGDFHLLAGSPAIDRGNPSFTPAPGETDLDGQARLTGTAVDLGADEIAGAEIFSDGFESGGFSAWSAITP